MNRAPNKKTTTTNNKTNLEQQNLNDCSASLFSASAYAATASASASASTFDQHRAGKIIIDNSEPTPLNVDFIPGPFDVICIRGRAACNHPGNRRYQVIIDMHLQNYATSTSKSKRSAIVSSIIDSIRVSSPNGGFVQQRDDGRWYQVSENTAREKVGQSLRNMLDTQYSSSSKAKKRRKEAKMKIRSEEDSSSQQSEDQIDIVPLLKVHKTYHQPSNINRKPDTDDNISQELPSSSLKHKKFNALPSMLSKPSDSVTLPKAGNNYNHDQQNLPFVSSAKDHFQSHVFNSGDGDNAKFAKSCDSKTFPISSDSPPSNLENFFGSFYSDCSSQDK